MNASIIKRDLPARRGFISGLLLLGTMILVGAPAIATAQNLQGNAKGLVTTPLSVPPEGTPVLRSFYFRFLNEDHHYSAMGVQPNTPTVHEASLTFQDTNGDDEYFYNITFVPYFGEFAGGNTIKQSGRRRITFPLEAPRLTDAVFVITRFRLSYQGDDHHIDEIGIQEKDGQVTVALNDKNDDDPFDVDLSYLYIPRSSFSEIGERSGSARAGDRATIPTGMTVIRGFHFDFDSGDRHLKEIGVLTGQGRLEVYYGDKTPDDLFTWNVAYGVLGYPY